MSCRLGHGASGLLDPLTFCSVGQTRNRVALRHVGCSFLFGCVSARRQEESDGEKDDGDREEGTILEKLCHGRCSGHSRAAGPKATLMMTQARDDDQLRLRLKVPRP